MTQSALWTVQWLHSREGCCFILLQFWGRRKEMVKNQREQQTDGGSEMLSASQPSCTCFPLLVLSEVGVVMFICVSVSLLWDVRAGWGFVCVCAGTYVCPLDALIADVRVYASAFLWGTLFPLAWLGVELIFVVLEMRVVCQQQKVGSPGLVEMTLFSSLSILHPFHPSFIERRLTHTVST